ncbi:hypothetical protein AB0C38_11315 [Amycolatopsis sp. NPDC048633]|uniref:hypothetical protein n=1 Tax=Amycolatopsis sp. NPDC048633 TaxID=3157095 RepID=UPI0033E5AA94
MPPKPRRIRVDGDELVVLTGRAYENLASHRRQAGAQGARIRALRTQLDQLSTFVDRLERTAADLPECKPMPCAACAGAECARDALLAALADRPPQTGNR